MQTLEQDFVKQWRKLEISPQDKVLLAVSTGVDSMVLLWLVQHLPVSLRPKIYVAYVDHQLRLQSKTETRFIRDYCQAAHLPLFVKVWQDPPQKGIENAARNMRYKFFETIMQKEQLNYLVTAHHGDDQAETFLMKLVRGGDVAQLVGIRSQRSFTTQAKLVRPLLAFSKQQLLDFAHQKKLVFFEDETNQSQKYFRNRMRHELLPHLKEENPHFLTHVTQYSEQLATLLQGCEEVAVQKLSDLMTSGGYSISKWQKLSHAWQYLTVRQLFLENELVLEQQQLQQILKLLQNKKKPQGNVTLKHAWNLKKEYDVFKLTKLTKQEAGESEKIELQLGQWQSLEQMGKLGLFKKDQFHPRKTDDFLVVSAKFAPFYLRKRKPGDRLVTSVGHQKVKKIMIDQKIPSVKRNELWCLVNGRDEVYWIFGVKKTDLSPSVVNAKMQYIIVLRREEK